MIKIKTNKNDSPEPSKENREKHALQLGLHYLSFKPRTKHEVNMYLRRKGHDDIIIDKALEKLSYYKYIDDRQYATDYISNAIRAQKKSASIVKMELKKKGIPSEIIEDCIPVFSHDINLEIAKGISNNYFFRKSNLPYKQLKNKLSQFLARKGFTLGVINSCLNYLDENKEIQSIVASNTKHHLSQATKLAEKYLSKYSRKENDPYLLKQKIKHMLYRKGYSKNTINLAVENILNKG